MISQKSYTDLKGPKVKHKLHGSKSQRTKFYDMTQRQLNKEQNIMQIKHSLMFFLCQNFMVT